MIAWANAALESIPTTKADRDLSEIIEIEIKLARMIRISRVEWMVDLDLDLELRPELDRVGVDPQIEKVANLVDDAFDLDHSVHSNFRVAWRHPQPGTRHT